MIMEKYNTDRPITDQSVKEKYQKETGQVHAPADLIRRTKEAVQAEEQRVLSEGAMHKTAAQAAANKTVGETAKEPCGRKYRLALPLTAAAALCIALLSISVIGIGGRTDKSASGGSANMTVNKDIAMDMAKGASDAEAGAEAGTVDMAAGQTQEAETGVGTVDMAAGQMQEAETDAGTVDMAAGQVQEAEIDAGAADAVGALPESASAAKESLEVTNGGMAAGDAMADMAESYIDSAYGDCFKIETMDDMPSFAGESEWESVTVHGVGFQVTCREDGAWCAYTTESSGKIYVISTDLTKEELSREDFLEKAYELLTDKHEDQ